MKKLKLLIFLTIIILVVFTLNKINISDLKNQALQNLYPKKYSKIINKYSYEYVVDPDLIYAIVKVESNFDEKAESTSGAIGLMQIMETTANEVAERIDLKKHDLYNSEHNIEIGIAYFSVLIEKYNNINLAIVAYNAGMGNVDMWIQEGKIKKDGTDVENVPFKESNNYVRKVLKTYEIYKDIY